MNALDVCLIVLVVFALFGAGVMLAPSVTPVFGTGVAYGFVSTEPGAALLCTPGTYGCENQGP